MAKLEPYEIGGEHFVACSDCLRKSGRDTSNPYMFDHYSSDPNVDAGDFRLRGAVPSYELRQPYGATTYDTMWVPAGDGIVRCRRCMKTFALTTGEEGDL